ncbi:MAG: sensor histidine kinase [Clostridium sp.]|uniref:sensor histidine kinase n=1 Tax=Clostridium sp. TaxID=1506 RepID=UPI003D6D74BD
MDFLLIFISLIFAFIDYRRSKYNYKGICEAINKEDNIDASLPNSSYSFEVQLMKDIINLKNAEMEGKVQKVKLALEEIDDYITKWVHEIKIPVSVCELLSDKIEEIDVSEQLILEFNRIKFLINQVLYTSRASSYSEDLQISEVNIEKLVKEVVKRNATLFISKNVSLELGNINYTVISDEKWLSYIVDQLINNACKYVPNDGKINIYAKDEDKVIVLYVKDSGIGIKTKDIKRIFDRGFTGENGRCLAKSTGMGLYLSKKMAHKLSHDIYVKSEEGLGTEFSICFYKLSDYFKVT